MTLTAATADDYDVTSDWHVSNPYPFLRRLRQEHPVFHSRHLGAWVITRYEDVRAALADERRFSSRGILTASTVLTDEVRALLGARGAFLERFVANVDPPDHTRLRRAVARAFTPRAVAALGDQFRALVHASVDEVVGQGGTDMVATLATAAPARLMAAFVGVPPEDEERVRRWVADWFVLFLAPHDPARQPALAASFLDYLDYVDALITDRLRAPREDFASLMAGLTTRGGDPAEALSHLDVVEQISALLLGGNDTVPNALASAVYRLLDGRLWHTLVDQPDRIPAAVEETLRYDGAATGIFRRTTTEVRLHDQTIPAGALVFVSQDSAGHDETVFADPERYDVDRPNAAAHLAFGHGIHHCVGAALTRLELTTALSVLTTRLPSMRLVPDQPIRHRPSVTGRGLAALAVEWDERA